MFTVDDLKKTRYFQAVTVEVRAEGLQEGLEQEQGELMLLLSLLTRQLGALSSANQDRLLALSLEQIEALSLELFDLQSDVDRQH